MDCRAKSIRLEKGHKPPGALSVSNLTSCVGGGVTEPGLICYLIPGTHIKWLSGGAMIGLPGVGSCHYGLRLRSGDNETQPRWRCPSCDFHSTQAVVCEARLHLECFASGKRKTEVRVHTARCLFQRRSCTLWILTRMFNNKKNGSQLENKWKSGEG